MGFLDDALKAKKSVTKTDENQAPKPAAAKALADKVAVDQLAPKKEDAAPAATGKGAEKDDLEGIPDASQSTVASIQDIEDDDDDETATVQRPSPAGEPQISSSADKKIDAEIAALTASSAPAQSDDVAELMALVGQASAPLPAQSDPFPPLPPMIAQVELSPWAAGAPPNAADLPSALAPPNPEDFAPSGSKPAIAVPPGVAASAVDSKLAMIAGLDKGTGKPVGTIAVPGPKPPGGIGPTDLATKKESSWKKWTKGVVVVAAVVAAAMIGNCQGKKTVVPQIVQGCKDPNVCMVDPAPKTCDVNKGTPGTMYFDEKTCGYCGQISNKGQYMKMEWMTPDNCPIVFTCGNHSLDKDSPYPLWVKDEKGVFHLSTATVTESCKEKDANYCAEDCPTKKVGRVKSSGSAEPVSSAVPVAPVPGSTLNAIQTTSAERSHHASSAL